MEKQQYRSHNCGMLRNQDVGQIVTLSGWIHDMRVKKFAIFLDLRDSYGLTQIVVPKADESNYQLLKNLKNESVVQIVGQVVTRKVANPKLATGAVEVVASKIDVLSLAENVPFVLNDETNFTALEDLRLKYRYLDLRRAQMQAKLAFKHQVVQVMRNFLNQAQFLEVDTPCLTKSTPEGARDFLVPARMKKNSFYALPQSPQLYKQLLMIGGVDRYYQIAKCFRDEDFRADRQPEFQQLDLEMAFVGQEDVMMLVEKLLATLWSELALPAVKFPIARLSYDTAINDYGSDKPDLRCSCKLQTLLSIQNEHLRAFWVADNFNDKTKQAILRIVSQHQGKHFFVYSLAKAKLIYSSSPKKVLNEQQLQAIKQSAPAHGQICFLTYEPGVQGALVLGAIRNYYCQDLEKQQHHQDFLHAQQSYQFVWIVDWPMFELVENKLAAAHHPFTSPVASKAILAMKATDHEQLLTVRSAAYDLVLNGAEIAGGSVRISSKEVQNKIFEILALDASTIKQQFGFFLEAFNYGVPPHAGIAFGLDRFLMMLTNSDSIRELIAFPKNNSGVDLLTNAPSGVDEPQLTQLGLKILNDKL